MRYPSLFSFKHGLKRKYYALLKRLRAAKKGVDVAAGEKPTCIKTHLRNMIILPEVAPYPALLSLQPHSRWG